MAALLAVASFPDGASSIARTSRWCDSIDFVEWKTGKRTEGISFSMQNFLAKLTSGITMFINGIVLNALGYREQFGLKGQPARFYRWQWPIYLARSLAQAVPDTGLTIHYKSMKMRVENELAERRAALAQAQEESIAAEAAGK